MNKEQIINKSILIVNRSGLQSLTISRLAQEFNVKPPSLYKHIANLREIQDELGILFIRSVMDIVQQEALGRSGEKAIKNVCQTFRKFSVQNPGLYQTIQLTHVFRNLKYQEVAASFLELLYRLIEPYKIEKKKRIHAIRALRCLLHGFIDLEIQKGFGLPDDLDKSFDLAIDGYILTLKTLY